MILEATQMRPTTGELEKLPYKMFDPMSSKSLCLIVTNACNLKCQYCFNYVIRNNERMSAELAVSIVDFYACYQGHTHRGHFCPQIIFFGGEPTLNPEAIFKVMDYMNQHHLDCVPRLVTNGIMPDRLLERFIEEKFYFQISFDGLQSQFRTDKSGTCVNSRIIQTVEAVTNAHLPIFLRATIHSENVDEMVDIVRFAIAHKINAVAFKPVVLEREDNLQNGVKRPRIEDYIGNYFSALELALRSGVNFYSAEIGEYQRKAKSHPPPLVWFPDGHLAFTIKYASAREHNATTVIIGRYSEENKQVEFDVEKIEKMTQNFIHNQELHCMHCLAFQYCKGQRCFDLFAANDSLKNYDTYSCDITRKIVERLDNYALGENQPY
jgi:sulfatase maturation enzyme AslB (radical SAM superfamily)